MGDLPRTPEFSTLSPEERNLLTARALVNEPFEGTGKEAKAQLTDAKSILETASEKELLRVQESVERMLEEIANSETYEQAFSRFETVYGWERTETIAMLNVMQVELSNLGHWNWFSPEHDDLDAGSRNFISTMLEFIRRDYGYDTAQKIMPLLLAVAKEEFDARRANGPTGGEPPKQNPGSFAETA